MGKESQNFGFESDIIQENKLTYRSVHEIPALGAFAGRPGLIPICRIQFREHHRLNFLSASYMMGSNEPVLNDYHGCLSSIAYL